MTKARRNKLIDFEDIDGLELYVVHRWGGYDGNDIVAYLGVYLDIEDAKKAAHKDAMENKIIVGHQDITIHETYINSDYFEMVWRILQDDAWKEEYRA